MYGLWKIGKYTSQSSSADRRGTVMSGNCLAQLTQCDHGTWTIPVLGRTGIPHRLQSQGMSTKAAAAQEPPCNEEIAQGNREKSFFIPPLFRDVPAYLSLITQSRTNGAQAAAGKSFQSMTCKAWGWIFPYWVLLLRTYIPHNRITS